jgi:hypothetical protein
VFNAAIAECDTGEQVPPGSPQRWCIVRQLEG